MRDAECIEFLQWALPRMGFRWPGFRKVRGQVCKRISRRMREIGVSDLISYRQYLLDHPEEWPALDACCRVTISRFGRDREVFRILLDEVLPELARRLRLANEIAMRIWSAGCGAGEEPYSLAALAIDADDPDLARVSLRILATDAEPVQIERALSGIYPASSLRELPDPVRERAFAPLADGMYRLKSRHCEAIEFLQQDLRYDMPGGSFHLILCRNLAFTYFGMDLQRKILRRLLDRLSPAGFLVIGSHEQLPSARSGLIATRSRLAPHALCPCILGPLAADPVS